MYCLSIFLAYASGQAMFTMDSLLLFAENSLYLKRLCADILMSNDRLRSLKTSTYCCSAALGYAFGSAMSPTDCLFLFVDHKLCLKRLCTNILISNNLLRSLETSTCCSSTSLAQTFGHAMFPAVCFAIFF